MGLFFYNLFIRLYQLAAALIAGWNPKARQWIEGRKQLFNRIEEAMRNRGDQPLVWVHCASLGEFEQGRPLIERIRAEKPSCRILVSFYSPSGYEIRKNYQGADYVFYLPVDSRQNAARFIDLVRPNLVLWVKYEYWYHYLINLQHRGIPVLLVSAIFREEQAFFKWYGGLHRRMIRSFQHLFVQTPESADLLRKIPGIPPVIISGDTRFDRVQAIVAGFKPIPEIEAFCGSAKVIVAGSTWEEDEEEMDHFANTHPEIRFIIAPHQVDQLHIDTSMRLFKKAIRYSEWKPAFERGESTDRNVLIIDNIGMLSRLYHYAAITYVGGGFGNDGIHNILEAAVYGKPVIFGPAHEKFREAIELLECGGAFAVSNALELEEIFNRLLNEPPFLLSASQASEVYTRSKVGATDTIMQFINNEKLL